MIKINFSPVRLDEQTKAELNGLVLTVNNEEFDLSEVPEGATVNHEVIQNCTRNGGDFELTLTLAHGASAPRETRFPEPVTINSETWQLEYVFNLTTELSAEDLAGILSEAAYDENGNKLPESEIAANLEGVIHGLD